MISALIFSMNRVENVVKLSEKIKDYVDEIVIIDSSDKEKFEGMRKKIPYAKILKILRKCLKLSKEKNLKRRTKDSCIVQLRNEMAPQIIVKNERHTK